MTNSVLESIKTDMKQAMKAGEKEKLAAIRLILAQVKQYEVDNRKEVDEETLFSLLTKMAKQRNESIDQFKKADRTDLVEKETFELNVIQSYLPKPLSDEEISAAIDKVMAHYDAPTIRDMGKIMAELKSQLTGRADMAQVSQKIKEKLS